MKPLFKVLLLFSVIHFYGQTSEIDQQKITKNLEEHILLQKGDSISYLLNKLPKSYYTNILRKISEGDELSYVEYNSYLNSVTNNKSIDYLLISDFINDFVKQPRNTKKINLTYVNIKWNQVNKLRDDETLEAATVEHEKLEAYISKFNESNVDVLRAKTKITTHPIVMYMIQQDIKGKELCLKSIETARKLKDISLEIVFLYHLTDFLVNERKLQEYINISEQGLKLESKLPKKSNYYFATVQHLVDAYIYKQGNDERVKTLLNELYEDPIAKIYSYSLYTRFLASLDDKSPQKKELLNKFQVKNTLELVEKFRVLGKNLNQHEFIDLLSSSAKALVAHGFYEQGITYKNSQIELVKNIYSKDLSKTLATYKTKNALIEKELEITHEKDRAKFFIIIAVLIGLFFLVSLFILRKIKRQSAELSKKNVLINNTLKEKELLVKEVHHRVKNNFQIVSSLLELQSKGIEDEKALALANEGKNRVKSMALIHQKLYQDKSGLVNFDEYIQLLVKELGSLYRSKNKIKTNISSKNMKFDVDTAIPLGLIINELITNSYKYAFGESKENELLISINKEVNEDFKLVIEDNGPGISEDFDIKKAKSLGLRLVNRLVKQLHGKLNVTNKNGTRFEIFFKDIHARKLVN